MSYEHAEIEYRNSQLKELNAQQVDNAQQIVDSTALLKDKIKGILAEFESIPEEIKGTKRIIGALNKDMDKLEKNKAILGKETNLNINASQTPKPTPPKKRDLDKLSNRQKKKYQQENDSYEEESKAYDDRMSARTNAMEGHLDKSLQAIEQARMRLEELSKKKEEYEEAKRREQTPQTNEAPKEDKSKESKEKSGSKTKDRGVWSGVAKAIGGTFRIALLPVTATLGVISGAVTGIWNSYLMSIVKTGALLGAIVLGFDWLQVTMELLRQEFEENMGVFKKGEVMDNALSSMVEMWNELKRYLGMDYNEKWVDNASKSFTTLLMEAFVSAMDLVTSGLTHVFYYLMAGLGNWLHSKFGIGDGNNTVASMRSEYVESFGDVNNKQITEDNYNDVIEARVGQKNQSVASMLREFNDPYRKIYENGDDAVNGFTKNKNLFWNPDSTIAGEWFTEIVKQYAKDFKGMNDADAKMASVDDISLRQEVYDSLKSLNETMKSNFKTQEDYQEFLKRMSNSVSSALRFTNESTVASFSETASKVGLIDEVAIRNEVVKHTEKNLRNNGDNLSPKGRMTLEAWEQNGTLEQAREHRLVHDYTVSQKHAIALEESASQNRFDVATALNNLAESIKENGNNNVNVTNINKATTVSSNTPSGGILAYGSGYSKYGFGR